MTGTTKKKDENKELTRWAARAQLALAKRGVHHYTAVPLLEEVKASCAENGQPPEELFGTPEEFAEAALLELPPDTVPPADTQGLTSRDHLTGAPFLVTLWTLAASVLYAVLAGTLSFGVSAASLTGTVLLALAVMALSGPADALRSAGHLRLAPWPFALAALLAAGSAAAFTQLSRDHLVTIPLWAIVVVGVAALLFQLRGSKPPRPGAADPESTDAWLDRLVNLLIGRHDLPPQRARELAGEAREHLRVAGTTPGAEFGPLDEYARDLAEPETVRQPAWWRSTPGSVATHLIALALGAGAFVAWLHSAPYAAYLLALPFAAGRVFRLIRLFVPGTGRTGAPGTTGTPGPGTEAAR
ncbi:hypothetical protein AB0O07_18370 [Streptomyces sp. NPDC093085]|uniref:hypothetical protein n=1 Tax=Streptomyces sp. NPDC093085 TaxID=3155068 RepID=UPI0034274046